MTQPTNLFDRYDGSTAVRESLSDVIYNISPEETPFMSNVGKGTAKQTYNEWQTDALAAASTSNAVIEGDDSALEARTPTVRQGNYTQISKKVIGVSGTVEAVDKAGIKSYMAYEMAKAGSELKTDMESILLHRQIGVAGDSSTARKTAGLPNWITNNTNLATTGTAGVDAVFSGGGTSGYPSTDRVEGTQRAFTEVILKDVVSQMWTAGAKIKMLMVGPFNKQAASAFAGLADARFNVSSSRSLAIIATADVYLSDFGELSIVPNRFQRERDGLFLDPEFIKVDYLRDFRTEDLAKTGDSTKKQMLVEYSLCVKNEKALGLAADLTAS